MRTPASKTEKPPVITIDGPSGSGKGAITHKLAQRCACRFSIFLDVHAFVQITPIIRQEAPPGPPGVLLA